MKQHAFNLQKNAFKRCINTCTFHDDLLFYICSADGPNQIFEFFACVCIFTFTTQWKVQSIALNFGTTLACVLLCLIILIFLASLLLKLRSQGQCFFGKEYLANCVRLHRAKTLSNKIANDSLPKSLWQVIFSSVYTRRTETHQILPEQIHLSV